MAALTTQALARQIAHDPDATLLELELGVSIPWDRILSLVLPHFRRIAWAAFTAHEHRSVKGRLLGIPWSVKVARVRPVVEWMLGPAPTDPAPAPIILPDVPQGDL